MNTNFKNLLLASVLMIGFLSSCASSNKNSNRKPAFTTWMEKYEPCRATDECVGSLVCRAGYCTDYDAQSKGEASEHCSNDYAGITECLSGICKNNVCQPSATNKAPNNFSCSVGAFCRSGVCEEGYCKPSAQFQGLPKMSCELPADCVSNLCQADPYSGQKVCGYLNNRAAACAPVGARVTLGVECCSQSAVGGVCLPVADSRCTEKGDCGAAIGRTCADIGTQVVVSSQCCSGRKIGLICAHDYTKTIQPCSDDHVCRGGFCDRKFKICRGR